MNTSLILLLLLSSLAADAISVTATPDRPLYGHVNFLPDPALLDGSPQPSSPTTTRISINDKDYIDIFRDKSISYTIGKDTVRLDRRCLPVVSSLGRNVIYNYIIASISSYRSISSRKEPYVSTLPHEIKLTIESDNQATLQGPHTTSVFYAAINPASRAPRATTHSILGDHITTTDTSKFKRSLTCLHDETKLLAGAPGNPIIHFDASGHILPIDMPTAMASGMFIPGSSLFTRNSRDSLFLSRSSRYTSVKSSLKSDGIKTLDDLRTYLAKLLPLDPPIHVLTNGVVRPYSLEEDLTRYDHIFISFTPPGTRDPVICYIKKGFKDKSIKDTIKYAFKRGSKYEPTIEYAIKYAYAIAIHHPPIPKRGFTVLLPTPSPPSSRTPR